MKVLITGATGLIGKTLIPKILERGDCVAILSRKKSDYTGCNVYQWDYKKRMIEDDALRDVDAIIHLAGASVSERWTPSYKKEIRDSRIETTQLLFDKCSEFGHFPKVFISASGSSFYGQVTQEIPFQETDTVGDDFIAEVAKDWEIAADLFLEKSRVVKLRTGLVLSNEGGALEKLKPITQNYLASPLGSGRQIYPWLHINDIRDCYLAALYNSSASGVYNAAAPAITSNSEFTIALAKSLGKKVLLPNVPSFILKMILGEMSIILLEGSPLNMERTERELHKFKYREIFECFESLWSVQ